MTSDRPNTELAAAVDQALAVLEQQGPRAAADFLEARGAGFALTCRVLREPTRRRSRHEAVLFQEGLARAAGGEVFLNSQLQRDKISLNVRSNQPAG